MAIFMSSKITEPHPTMVALIEEVGVFLKATGMGASYFGRVSVGNSELWARLNNGCEIRRSTEQRLREYLRAERIKRDEFPDVEAAVSEAAE